MTTISARLPDDLVERVDALVRAGTTRSRSDALRDALLRYLADHERRQVDEAIRAGYARHPPPVPDDGVRERAIRSIEEEDW